MELFVENFPNELTSAQWKEQIERQSGACFGGGSMLLDCLWVLGL